MTEALDPVERVTSDLERRLDEISSRAIEEASRVLRGEDRLKPPLRERFRALRSIRNRSRR